MSQLAEAPYRPNVICVSIDSKPQTVIECMRRGAADFLLKPFSLADLRGAVNRALDRDDEAIYGSVDQNSAASTALIGVSPAVQELRRVINQAGRTDLNCLIRGESGVGKDVVAREIHRLSTRRDKPFIKVNCTALPENLLESELFGYEKGAFTGADTAKPGRFSLAHSGVIFLDEIGDMHPYVQAKILQVIEHKEFTKLGGGSPVKVEVQIIVATNADLDRKIAEGAFRQDLFFRLNEVNIWVPPLRERREDIPLLVRHFLRKHGQYSSTRRLEISSRDLEALVQYNWPGNVRELESTVKRWLALGKPTSVAAAQSNAAPRKAQSASSQSEPQSEPEPVTPERILEALDKNQWNRRRVAQILGISYSALRRHIEKHELDRRRTT